MRDFRLWTRRWEMLALSVSLLGACGCFMPLGVAYPTVSYTPKFVLNDDAAVQVHAYRVDFTEHAEPSKRSERLQCQFSPIRTDSDNEIPRQVTAGMRYFWALYFVPGGADPMPRTVHCRDHWVRVRLYRRGFKTIELGPEGIFPTSWEDADSLKEREEAIDALAGIKRDSVAHLSPGHISKNQEAFLKFAADEYFRLGEQLNDVEAEHRRMRMRLTRKHSLLCALSTE